jgi:chromosome segregation ATPase
MGAEANARFLKARIRALEDELEHTLGEQRDGEEGNKAVQKQLDEANKNAKKDARAMVQLEAKLKKANTLTEQTQANLSKARSQLAAAETDLIQTKRNAKKETGDSGTLQVRLNRALEQVAALKEAQQVEERERVKVNSGAADGQVEKYLSEIRKLERQKKELLTAFKKQLKLIDVLKRQKLHMEAAMQLGFTETEFNQVLELQGAD